MNAHDQMATVAFAILIGVTVILVLTFVGVIGSH